jgi:hypothetical protein
MFIQINQLYLDTNKIETLGVFEIANKESYEIGIVLNNARYFIYNFNGFIPDEVIKEARENVIKLLEQIIQCARVELKRLNVPEIDSSKYMENIVSNNIQKEPIND